MTPMCGFEETLQKRFCGKTSKLCMHRKKTIFNRILRRKYLLTFLNFRENDPTLGSEIVHFAVPDSISTFAINGLAFSDDFGSGVLLNAPEIQTMQPFFIAMDLPFSIQQVETLTQTILVHNYSPFNMTGLITMRRDPDRFFLVNSARDGWSGEFVGLIYLSVKAEMEMV